MHSLKVNLSGYVTFVCKHSVYFAVYLKECVYIEIFLNRVRQKASGMGVKYSYKEAFISMRGEIYVRSKTRK